jgi:putative FmdB family regulatory protein
MPIYEYECSECGARFEQWQRMGDSGPVTCPNGHSRIRRLLSQPTIIFKGSGFYATDHGGNGAGRSPRKRRSAEPSEPSANSAKVDPAP